MSLFTTKFTFWFLVVFVTFFNVILSILKAITRYNPTPYIDEIFHIPQAQQYCRNEFYSWDSKITTLPGLYLISVAVIKPLEWALGLSICSVYGLRFVNVIGTLLNFVLCYSTQQKIAERSKAKPDFCDVISSLNIALFPPLFFFTFLYYTDVWSTAFVLLMYNLHLSKLYWPGAISGICATLMRQTNIIWVGLMLLDSAWGEIAGKERHNIANISAALRLLRIRFNRKVINSILWLTLPYLAICSFFMAFVILNDGIVVGDRKAHTVVLHPMQNLYYLDVAACFAAPYIIFEVEGIRTLRRKLPLLCTIWIFFAVVSEYNFMEHPYLLADNRHLAFYIWRRSFGHSSLRRLLTPTYVLAGYLLLKLLRRLDLIFLICLGLCTVANLTPQYLFELRYFIIPFIFFRLHFPRRPVSVFLEAAFFIAINALTFYIFINKEFKWHSEPGVVQRIIW